MNEGMSYAQSRSECLCSMILLPGATLFGPGPCASLFVHVPPFTTIDQTAQERFLMVRRCMWIPG
jgi:hypothetical protein